MTFVRRYAGFLAFALGVVFAYVFLRRPRPAPIRTLIETELSGIRAESDAEKKVAKLGIEGARRAVEEDYAHVKRQLDQTELRSVAILEHDPVALARFLARVGRKRRL